MALGTLKFKLAELLLIEDVTDGYKFSEESAKYVDSGAQFVKQERYSDAEKAFRKAIEINPMNATAHANMEVLFLRKGEPEKAIQWVSRWTSCVRTQIGMELF